MHDNGRNGLGRDRSSGVEVEKLLSRDVRLLVVVRRFFIVPFGMLAGPATGIRPGNHPPVVLGTPDASAFAPVCHHIIYS